MTQEIPSSPYDDYDYFFCFSGFHKNDPEYRGFFRFQEILYAELTRLGYRCYYSPVVGQGDSFNNMEGLQKLMHSLKRGAIVFLDPDFWNNFLPYVELSRDQVKGDKRELNVVQKEMMCILKEARDGSRPKSYITYVWSDGYFWNPVNRSFVKGIFDNDEIATSEKISWNLYLEKSSFRVRNTEEIRRAALDCDEKRLDQELKKQAHDFMQNFLGIDWSAKECAARFREDLDLCFHTLLTQVEKVYFDEFITDSTQKDKPFAAYVTEAIKGEYRETLKEYGRLAEKEGNTLSVYWKVFFSDPFAGQAEGGDRAELFRIMDTSDFEKKNSTINSCALMFGLLSFYHRYKKLESDESIPKESKFYYMQYIQGALNLVTLMQNRDEKLGDGWWCEEFCFNAEKGREERVGLNQTTLALSVLLSVDFLDREAGEEIYRNRLNAIVRGALSLFTLKRGGKLLFTERDGKCYWSEVVRHGGDARVQCGSTLMTAMVFDTLLKICQREEVAEAVNEAMKKGGFRPIGEYLKEIIAFFLDATGEKGGMIPCLGYRFAEEEEDLWQADGEMRACDSMSHTAKILNSITTFLSSPLAEKEEFAQAKEQAERISKICVPYLLDLIEEDESRFWDRSKQKYYEQFNVPDTLFGETGENGRNGDYEIFAELFVVTALLKLVRKEQGARYLKDYCDEESLSRTRKRLFGAAAENGEGKTRDENADEVARRWHLHKLIDRLYRLGGSPSAGGVVLRFQDKTATSSLYVKGVRSDPSLIYPIYLIYYYRMALEDALDAIECEG